MVEKYCKNCKYYEYIDRFLSVCDLGRVKEFDQMGGITDCEYWEAKK